MRRNRLLLLAVFLGLLTWIPNSSADNLYYRPTPFQGEDTWAPSVSYSIGVNYPDLLTRGAGNGLYRYLLKSPQHKGLLENISNTENIPRSSDYAAKELGADSTLGLLLSLLGPPIDRAA